VIKNIKIRKLEIGRLMASLLQADAKSQAFSSSNREEYTNECQVIKLPQTADMT
jgi:hypothetical protein